jgi:hypothetical protein
MSARTARFAGAALASGVFAAVGVVGHRLGAGVVVAALLVAGSVALAGGAPRAPEGPVLAALTLGLCAFALLRDASWLIALDLAGACFLGALAMTGATSWRAILLAPLSLRPLRGAVLVSACAAQALPPGTARGLAPALRGVAAGVVLLAVFGSLFAWADPAFAEITDAALPTGWNLDPLPLRLLLAAVVPALAGALVLAARRPPSRPGPARRSVGAAESICALLMVDLLFATFVAVQVTVLFGGEEHVLRTAGLTYAEYAREGFGQLLAVGVLALALVAGAVHFGRPETPRRAHLLRGLLGLLVVLTVVVLASAVHRLGLYEEAFGFTRERLVAHAFMLWLAGVFALVLLALALGRGAWLRRTVTIGTGFALLAFSAANPDALVAERNLERAKATGRVDLAYLARLSADATPQLTRLPARHERVVLRNQAERLAAPDGWAGWNLARERARDALRAAARLE